MQGCLKTIWVKTFIYFKKEYAKLLRYDPKRKKQANNNNKY